MSKKTILIIEDNNEVRENLAEILELSNYDAITAENGKIGVQKAIKHLPDLIICDVMMPELDGFGVLRILDSMPSANDIPFIFLTAKADKMDIRKGMNLGADDYITKPFDDVDLLDAIDMRLKKSERLKSAFDGTTSGLDDFLSIAKNNISISEFSLDREERHFKKKATIYREGQSPNWLYFVSKGSVKTFKINEIGKEFITGLHEKGSFLGFQDLIAGSKYSESAAALNEVSISCIPKEDFFKLLYNNRDFSARFVKMLSLNMQEMEAQLLSLAYSSIRKRVAEALIMIDSKNDGKPISILRDDLASIVGTAKESVIRTLTEFKNDDFIKIENGSITILNKAKLANLPD